MADEPNKTDGDPGAATGTDTQADTATATATDTAAEKKTGAEARIHGLTAERDRWKAKAEKAEAEAAKTREANKSEQEKLIEQAAAKIAEPHQQRANQYEEFLRSELASIMSTLPEDDKAAITDDLPILTQVKLARSLAAAHAKAQGKETKPAIDGKGNPAPPGKKPTYTRAQFQDWQRMAPDPQKRKEYEERREEMSAALREGRITEK